MVSRASAGRSRSGAASTARSRFGIEGDDGRPHLGPVAALDDRLVLAGDDVGVGDDEAVADHEPAPLLDAVARDALDLHGGRHDRVDHRLRDVRRRSAAGRRRARGSSASNTRGNWSSPTSRRSVSTVSGGSGKRSSTNRAIAERAGLRRRTTRHVGHQRQQDPDADEDADHARHGAGRLGRPSARVAPGQGGVQPRADEQPEGLPDEGGAEQDADGDEQELGASWRRRAARSTGGSTQRTDHDARARARPTTTTRARNPRR